MPGENDNCRNHKDKIWYTGTKDIAAALGCHRGLVLKLIEEENLPAFMFYGKWTARREDIDAWSRNIANKYRIPTFLKTRRPRRQIKKNKSFVPIETCEWRHQID